MCKLQSIPLIVPAVGPPKIGTIADLALNPILLQGGDGGWLLGWVDFNLGSSCCIKCYV